MTWKEVAQSSRGRIAMLFCLATLLMIVFYMPHFYSQIITPKKGLLLNDPILGYFTPHDWSLPVFSILYASLLQTIATSYRKPSVLLVGLTTYCLVNIVRLATMYGLTLEPPANMILLIDPISSLAYPDKGFAKDLFFSGHVSTLFVLILVEENKWARILKIIGAFVMAVFLAWQHVHYTVDLLAAPVITWACYLITRKVLLPDLAAERSTKGSKPR